MDTGIIVALITGGFTFAGVLVTVIVSNRKTSEQVKAQAEMTRYRIGELEKKQDKYNNLQARMYAAETDIAVNKEQIKVANHRIDDLEHKTA